VASRSHDPPNQHECKLCISETIPRGYSEQSANQVAPATLAYRATSNTQGIDQAVDPHSTIAQNKTIYITVEPRHQLSPQHQASYTRSGDCTVDASNQPTFRGHPPPRVDQPCRRHQPSADILHNESINRVEDIHLPRTSSTASRSAVSKTQTFRGKPPQRD
jgi:hypothetical protein